ncbi:MAG: GIY-YIG nuclease family protein [Parcubacteria group bacterium]
MIIKLQELIKIDNLKDYKLHLACWNNEENPLDTFVSDPMRWRKWNEWRGARDDFNRDYILSLIEYYPEPDTWLFGGIYKVLYRSPKKKAYSYKIELSKETEQFIGRLKLKIKRPARARAFVLEKYYDSITVSELLDEVYSGETFPGYENVNHSFEVLEDIFKRNKQDWKGALENVKGVYLITDKSNNRRYIGSAYKDIGIWSRWNSYINTGHGGNKRLMEVIKRNGLDYARKNFIFSILEYRSMKTDDQVIISREGYWKEVLLSREFGYNLN